ncbi:hypothetical protein KC19_7G145300 [Ceratodon purpureus]|uniref:Protein kinase domain-containing protein n=1 Tax=Ceratodon purpureus TaxID=3225 RepID=A0A8T0H8L6_CERPU|nr:hypothetical protein KC19_7G145300 [Ceratodon purpureus]
MAKRSDTTKLLLASIDKAKVLVMGQTLEFNKSQCKYLCQGLQELSMFLRREDVQMLLATRLILRHVSPSSSPCGWSNALLQLHSVVKRAENLVQLCCTKQSTFPKRALHLFAMKEYVQDILVYLRWWSSILSMVIDIPSSKLSIPERVKNFHQEFERGLEYNEELEVAVLEDRIYLLNKVNMEMQVLPDYIKLASKKRHYLNLLTQVRNRLTDSPDIHSTPQLNQYTPDSRNALLGQGSSGVVNKGKWCGLDSVLKQYENSKSDDIEVKSLKRLNHPHIVRIFRHWKDEAVAKYKSHIVMERMDKDLDQYIESVQRKHKKTRPPFSEPVAIDIMLQVINAIRHMHNKSIVHRDLKPQNILVRVDCENAVPELKAEGYVEVKLGDLGIARDNMETSNAGALTHKAGTTVYRAPELAIKEYTQGSKNYPRRADVWSFGIMCFRILTGKQPFEEIEGNIAKQEYIGNGGRPSIPDNCPDYLRFCMEKCWDMNPLKRPRAMDIWRMLRVAQLRSLDIIDQNYDLFMFKDHSNKQTLQLAPPASAQEYGRWRCDSSVAPVNQASVSFILEHVNEEFFPFIGTASRSQVVPHESGNSQGWEYYPGNSSQSSYYQSNIDPNYYSNYKPSQSYSSPHFPLVDHDNQPITNPDYLKSIKLQ